MPRNRQTERPRYAAKVRAYFARHSAGDSDARELSLEAIRRGAGVSRTPLSDEAETCPIIAELLAERALLLRGATASESAPAGPAVSADATGVPPTFEQMRTRACNQMPPGLDLLDDRVLTKRMRQCLVTAAKAMDGWNGRHGMSSSMDEVSLARHDLELLSWQLRSIADELGPLVEIREQRDVQQRRDQESATPRATVSGGGQTTMTF